MTKISEQDLAYGFMIMGDWEQKIFCEKICRINQKDQVKLPDSPQQEDTRVKNYIIIAKTSQ